MKKIQWIINRMFVSGVLLTVMLFIVPPTFGVSDGDKVSFYEYFYGAPLKWLNVTSITDERSSFTGTFFMGNEGISINWFNLLGSFLIIFVIVSIVIFLVKKYYSKERGKIWKKFVYSF